MFGYSDPNMALYKLSLCTHGSCKISHSKGPMWNHFFECSKYGAQFWPRHNFSAVSKSSQRMSCWLSIKSSGTCKKTHDSTGKLAFAIGDDEQHVAINNFEKKKTSVTPMFILHAACVSTYFYLFVTPPRDPTQQNTGSMISHRFSYLETWNSTLSSSPILHRFHCIGSTA